MTLFSHLNVFLQSRGLKILERFSVLDGKFVISLFFQRWSYAPRMTHKSREKRQARNCSERLPFIPLAVLTSMLQCSHLKQPGHQSSLTPGDTGDSLGAMGANRSSVLLQAWGAVSLRI